MTKGLSKHCIQVTFKIGFVLYKIYKWFCIQICKESVFISYISLLVYWLVNYLGKRNFKIH